MKRRRHACKGCLGTQQASAEIIEAGRERDNELILASLQWRCHQRQRHCSASEREGTGGWLANACSCSWWEAHTDATFGIIGARPSPNRRETKKRTLKDPTKLIVLNNARADSAIAAMACVVLCSQLGFRLRAAPCFERMSNTQTARIAAVCICLD